EVLGAVVDDAHQSRAGGYGRVPVGVHDAGQLGGCHARDVGQRELVHFVVVAGQQLGGCVHLRDLVGAVPVAGVVARQVETEPVDPAVAGPHLLDPGHMGQLDVLHPGTVPDQPGDAVGVRSRAVIGQLVGQPVGEIVDVFDQSGERVAKQLLRGGVGAGG